ncbi:MAG: aspartyl-tRNA(Asn)/glutamyl-tRNA(Gln) amidotransferase subunit [Thermosediminibacterales bacterium]|nr:aspartyl-tRNA(Asn)/glutamyl-tRNA(Gln) amidotransferase subunit [Thermosediminibacterales bacterium]
MEYEVVIGLEVHAELSTDSKIFCSCTTEFGGDPNTHCCPVCLGLPGVLPVINEKVIELAVKAALALNCEIAEYSKFDRKNYFYPDLPKAYQISQYDLPLAQNGYIEIEVDGKKKKIGITRVHIEEDAGKLVHAELGGYSLVDYNRTGVPLIEIVSEPDIRSPEEARNYLDKLKSILQYSEVSDCKMQEGSLRCDANISLRPKGSKEFGVKTELKNMNSFRAVQKALEAEVKRQKKILERGERVVQETLRWDEARGVTVPMRSKEEAHDYRYFPEPDLPPVVISKEYVERIKSTLPEMPQERKERYMKDYNLPEYDAGVLTDSKAIADFFEACVEKYHDPKTVSNWVMGELLAALKTKDAEIDDIPLTPSHLVEMLELMDKGTISGKIAKTVFKEMIETGKRPEQVVKEKGLVQITDEGKISEIIEKVIKENPKSVEDFKNGKEKAIGFLVGQVMRATKGKANPQIVNKLLREKLQ